MRSFINWFLGIDWLGLPRRVPRLWRRSLQFRAVALSVIFTSIAIGAIGIYMSIAVSSDLFNSRLDQVLRQSQRAQQAAQRIFDSGVASDRASVQNLLDSSLITVRDTSSSSRLAFYRVPTSQVSPLAPQNFASEELSGSVISPTLRISVRGGAGEQYWQSVTLTENGTSVPGVVVGSLVSIPSAGDYELYIAYSFAESEKTLAFMTQSLWFAGICLIIIIGAISWFVARIVVRPIRVAAQTSAKLAAGDLSARVPELGEDVLTTLARNFNDMARSMQTQVTSLEELSSMQQRFVADVSHELRTPLTVVHLAGDRLYEMRDQFEPSVRDTVDMLHSSVDRFTVLLRDLLEISRYDARTIKLDLEPTNLVHLVSEVCDELGPLAARHGSMLSVVSPGGHCEALVDSSRIRRIIVNLLGNAIEHGEGKPITVEVDSNSTAVSVVVDDRGVGLTQDQLAQVFDRFYRADPSRKRTLGGTGLGLSIAMEDAKIHRGTLEAWGIPGEGCRFRLTVPRDMSIRWTASPIPLERGAEHV
jgi:two-component system sensor histidine kinase MtrB